jgi:hypothetical protein
MLTNGIILTINISYILRHLGIEFKPFANSVRDTKYHKWFTMMDGKLSASGHLCGTLATEPIAAGWFLMLQ